MSHYKPYPAYRNSGVEWIGEVPEHWRETRLKFLGDYLNGYPFKPHEWVKSGLPIIRIAQLTGQEFDNYYDGIAPEHLKIKDGDLLFSWSATIDCFIWDRGDAWLNQHIFKVIPSAEASKRYLFHLLRHVTPKLAEFDAHGSTMRHIKKESLSEKVFVPSISEQERVAEAIDRETVCIDALITKKIRFIELLKEKRQALITHAVTKGLDTSVPMRETGVDWIGDVPEHWSVVQVRHVATLGSGHTPSRSRPDWWEDCCIPWFTLADIWQVRREGRRFVTETEEMVSELGIANSSAVVHPAGSVMLSRTASVGFPAIMGCAMATSQDFAVWRCGSRVVNEYLYLVLLGMKQELSRLMIGSTHKTIYMPDIEAFRMPLPPVEQQKEIIKYVGSELQRIDTVIAKTLRSIELLKERRAAFIAAAVTGQIDLSNQ